MELKGKSLVITREEAGILADCLRGFSGLSRDSHYGRKPTKQDKDRAKAEAQTVYEMVSPLKQGIIKDPNGRVKVPREELPRVELVLHKLVDNPMRAVDNVCLEWADDYNTHLRGNAYRMLGWVAEVGIALEQMRMHPNDSDEQLNQRFQRLDRYIK